MSSRDVTICIAPNTDADLVERIGQLGVQLTDDPAIGNALIWTGGSQVERMAEHLRPNLEWVQVSAAGVEKWLGSGLIDDTRTWTCAAGAYAELVGQHAIALLLAGVHGLSKALRLRKWAPYDHSVVAGSTSLVIGAGGIGSVAVAGLAALGSQVIAVTRSGKRVPHAVRSITPAMLDQEWSIADNFILAAPATPETHHLVNADAIAKMKSTAWIVNVGRGSIIDTDALVDAITNERIGGAALDVTDPMPLPLDHPLWASDRTIITSHSASPRSLQDAAYIEHVIGNVERFCAGLPLCGEIQLDRGY